VGEIRIFRRFITSSGNKYQIMKLIQFGRGWIEAAESQRLWHSASSEKGVALYEVPC
jgi:hypothetical protein